MAKENTPPLLCKQSREGITQTRCLARTVTTLLSWGCFQLNFTKFYSGALQIQTLLTSLNTQPFLSKNLLTCQCRSSPPEGPAPVRAAWLSAGEALTSKTSPVGRKTAGKSVCCISRFLQLSPQFLQQMKIKIITKLVGELSAQEQYNKSWSTRIMRHSMRPAGHCFETGK